MFSKFITQLAAIFLISSIAYSEHWDLDPLAGAPLWLCYPRRYSPSDSGHDPFRYVDYIYHNYGANAAQLQDMRHWFRTDAEFYAFMSAVQRYANSIANL